jgi:FlaA1/EpsC-like NDP-sugar epimerase
MLENDTIDSSISEELKNKHILVTGGAGSIGSYISKRILDYPVKSLRILDINEHSLFQLGREINDSRLRLLLGSITDQDRLDIASKDIDIIIHTAALKNIEITEFNPIETINTNVNGTVNLIKTIIKNNPKKFLNISTDKAADPSTLYGTTKNLSEKLVSWAGTHISTTKFASVRFGNVFETRGNVFEVWKRESEQKIPLSITDPMMKRYFFHIDDATEFVFRCLMIMNKGEIFIPKMKQYSIKELADQYSTDHKIIGLRKYEKMEEKLMTDEEKKIVKETDDIYIIEHQ